MRIDIVTLGAATLDPESGAPLVQALQPLSGDDDAEPFGDIAMMPCLGVSSMNYPPSAEGYCEAPVATGVGGANAVGFGGRDIRNASIVGNLKPGDTVLHTTGPNQAAQLQLKEDKRQAVLVVKKANGEQMLEALDGNAETYTLAVNGAVFAIGNDGTISAIHPKGHGIVIGEAGTHIIGPIILGGATPNPALSIMLGPVAGSPGGGAAAPLIAAPGVFIGQ